jgi:hypothetical protein
MNDEPLKDRPRQPTSGQGQESEGAKVSAAASMARATPAKPEPIYVFGTDLAGRHETETASLAVRLHGAEPGKGSGPTGNGYAIPYRNSTGGLLSGEVMKNYVTSLFNLANENPDTIYHVARFACEPDAHDDASMARLFAQAPANCVLPGLWSRLRNPRAAARLLIFDPGAHLLQPAWMTHFQRYLSINVPLWNVPSIELVSVGGARAVIANEAAAKKLGLRHRVIGASEGYYGRNAQLAAELRAIWYSTHLLSIFDFDMTAQPQQIRVMGAATRGGLQVDQLDAKLDE